MSKKKLKEKKIKEPRDIHAISAHFRLAGSMKDRRAKRDDDKGKQRRTHEEEWE